jgi:hypothetical protein
MVLDVRSVPAAEQIRQYVVNRLMGLNDIYVDMIYYKEIGRFSQPKIAVFRAELIGFYTFLRPKVIGYIVQLKKNDNEVNNAIAKDYIELLRFMDRFADKPSTFSVGDMIEFYKYIIQFCEDYDLTKTTISHITSDQLE